MTTYLELVPAISIIPFKKLPAVSIAIPELYMLKNALCPVTRLTLGITIPLKGRKSIPPIKGYKNIHVIASELTPCPKVA